MLSQDVLKQIRGIQLKAGHLVTDALAGNYLSAFKGRGMEFDEVREYVPGDDVRTIDWNVTARMHQPFVKVLREERELTLMLMVDVSPSQAFGTATRQKHELAAELAAVLAFLAIRNNDKVGLIAFSDHIEQFIPPKKGRGHVWNIIRSVLTHQGAGKTTDIGGALDYMMNVADRKCMCFLISDFWAQGYEKQLRHVARRHDFIAVRTLDERELKLPPAGIVAFQDAETGEELLLDTSDRKVLEAYEDAARERERGLESLFRKNAIDHFTLRTDGNVTAPLIGYLRGRERRRG